MVLDALKLEFTKLSLQQQNEFLGFALALRYEAEDTELSSEWQTEIKRRLESLRNGTAKTVSWEEVQSKINKKYGFDVDISR